MQLSDKNDFEELEAFVYTSDLKRNYQKKYETGNEYE